MPVRANASKLKRKVENLQRATGRVNAEIMREAVLDLVDGIESELHSIDFENQTGFDPDQFIENLRNSLGKRRVNVIDGPWSIDPWATGNEDDLEDISGIKDLWHMGKIRTEAYFRLIQGNPEANAELADERQSVWGERTPQWFLLEFGSPAAAQPATGFIQRAIDSVDTSRSMRLIQRFLLRSYDA